MNNGIKSLLGSFVVIAMGATTALAEDVTFTYKFQAGASERYRVKLNQDVSMGQMAVSNLGDMEVTVKCVSAADGKYSMELKFDKVDLSTTMMGQTSPNPMGDQLLGQSLVFKVDGSGEVSDIAPAGTFDSWPTARQVVEPVLESFYPYLPGKPVAVGSGWKKDGVAETESGGSESKVDAAFTFKAMKADKGRNVAVVEQVISATVGGKQTTPMGVFTVDGSGKGKGEFLYDPAKGRVVKAKSKLDLSMNMTPDSGGDVMETVVTNQVERDLLD